jgi:hypothetical protein
LLYYGYNAAIIKEKAINQLLLLSLLKEDTPANSGHDHAAMEGRNVEHSDVTYNYQGAALSIPQWSR